MSPSHLRGQQQPQSVPSSNSESRPSHPSFLPSLGFGRFSRGWVGRRESSRQTLPSPPPSSQTTGLGPQTPHLRPCPSGSRCGDWSHHDRGKGCFAPSPSFLQGRVQTRQGGAPQGFAPRGVSGLGSVRLFSFAVGRGGRGRTLGVGVGGEEWRGGKEEGASLLEHSRWSHSNEKTRMCTRSTVGLLPAPPAWLHPTPQGPFEDPREGFGGTAVEPFTLAPHSGAPSLFSPSRSREEEGAQVGRQRWKQY